MTLHAPQLIVLTLLAMSWGMAIVRHGEKETGTHDATRFTFSLVLFVGLLWWGGFFG